MSASTILRNLSDLRQYRQHFRKDTAPVKPVVRRLLLVNPPTELLDQLFAGLGAPRDGSVQPVRFRMKKSTATVNFSNRGRP